MVTAPDGRQAGFISDKTFDKMLAQIFNLGEKGKREKEDGGTGF